jgi:hypothetical protein
MGCLSAVTLILAVNVIVFIVNVAMLAFLPDHADSPQSKASPALVFPARSRQEISRLRSNVTMTAEALLKPMNIEAGLQLGDDEMKEVSQLSTPDDRSTQQQLRQREDQPFQWANTPRSSNQSSAGLQSPNGLAFPPAPQKTGVPIYFLHIYKSGGTTFCSTARGARKHIPPGLNCNLKRGLSKLPPREQLSQLKKYEVAANEYDGLPSTDSLLVSPSLVTYVVILRDPLDRLLSHFAAAQVFSRGNQGAFKNLGRLRIPAHETTTTATIPASSARETTTHHRERLCVFHECSFADFLHWVDGRRSNPGLAPPSLNLPWVRGDFMVRYFAGFAACDFGECTNAHLRTATARLERLFKVVIILEDLSGQPAEEEEEVGEEAGEKPWNGHERNKDRDTPNFGVTSKDGSSGGGSGGDSGTTALRQYLGWGAMRSVVGWPSEEAVRRAGTHRGSDSRRELAEDAAALASLVQTVGPRDLEFYEFAKALTRRRAVLSTDAATATTTRALESSAIAGSASHSSSSSTRTSPASGLGLI